MGSGRKEKAIPETGGDHALQGTSGSAWTRFGLPRLGEGVPTASGGQRVIQPHVHSAEAENPRLKHFSMDRSNAPGSRDQHEVIHTKEL